MELLSDNVTSADNQQGRPQVLEEPSETTRQTLKFLSEDIVPSAWRHAGSKERLHL